MIKEAYVSFEVAKLLREKGFEQHKCQHSYDSKGVFKWSDDLDPYEYSAPTHQMAMAWLREEKKLFVEIRINYEDGAYPMYDAFVHNVATCEQYSVLGYDRYFYNDAVEAALKYSLENLI